VRKGVRFPTAVAKPDARMTSPREAVSFEPISADPLPWIRTGSGIIRVPGLARTTSKCARQTSLSERLLLTSLQHP